MPARVVVADFEEPGWDYGIRRSPYHAFHQALGAKHCVYNGRLMPVSQRIDRFEGYRALRQRAALFDTGERPIEIAGRDAERLCNVVFARDVAKLQPGRAGYGLLLYPDGGILCDGVLMRLAADRFWYVQADGPVFSWLVAHAQGLDVRVSDPGSWVSQVQGPRALEVLAEAADGGVPDGFGYYAVRQVTMGGQPVLISRTGWTAELGFEFYTLPAEVPLDAAALWRHVLAAGAPVGMEVCGLDTMDIRRIEAGILNNISDMDETMTPFQAGLGAFLSLDGPDFVGRAALVGADRRPLLWGLRCPGGEPRIGGALTAAGRPAGHVTAGAWSPYLETGIAIVRLAEADHAEAGGFTVECRDGASHAADLASLPLYDPEKRIPRGQDTEIPNF